MSSFFPASDDRAAEAVNRMALILLRARWIARDAEERFRSLTGTELPPSPSPADEEEDCDTHEDLPFAPTL